MQWVVDLGGKHPKKRWVAFGALLIVLVAGLVWANSLPLTVIGLLIVTSGCAEVLLPTRYELNGEAAKSRCGLGVIELRWENVKSAWEDSDGVKLSPLPQGARMEGFRGVYLRFANNREQVLAKIALHWDGDVAVMGKGSDSGGDGSLDRKGSERDRAKEHDDARHFGAGDAQTLG